MSLFIYVPQDERFGYAKMTDFLAYALKFLAQDIQPALQGFLDGTKEIDSFKEIFKLYEGGFKLPPEVLERIRKAMPGELLKELFRTDGEGFLKFPKPHVIRGILISYLRPILFFHVGAYNVVAYSQDCTFILSYFISSDRVGLIIWSRGQVGMEYRRRICKRNVGWNKPCCHSLSRSNFTILL